MKRKIIRTEADLLEHSYGKKAEEVKATPSPAPTLNQPSELTDEEQDLVNKFVNGYNKDELIGLADDNEIDSSGVKADIATRLVKAGWAPE